MSDIPDKPVDATTPEPVIPNPQLIDMNELAGYDVAWSDGPTRVGWHIVTKVDRYSVFGLGEAGMSEEKSTRLKAFCDYWCFHLNCAYASGWVNHDGNSITMSPKMKARFDELYAKAFGP